MTPALIEEPKGKTGRFITLSMFVHAAMVATVALMSFPKSQVGKPEVIEIEMADESPASTMTLPDGMADTGSGAPAALPQEAMVSSEDVTPAPAPAPAPHAVVAPAAPAQTLPKVKSLPPPAPRAAVEAPRAPEIPQAPVAPEATSTVTPPSVQPSASQLETTDDGDVAVAPATTKVVEDETEKIDQDREQALAVEAEAREAKAAKEAAALAEEKAREEAKAAEAAAIANETRRAQEAQAAAAAQAEAQATAQAEKQARLQAAREARAKERADAEARAGTTSGTGAGDSASPEPTKQVAGIPGGVRTLGQLRQKPGNRSPQYDAKERLARQEGDVVFYAYVNTDGTLSDFKMAQSTGFTNLDDKTLAALKKWKFYPGQEGWVEMPFKWSLRGEAQQAGGLLR
jgi:TonB family protein